VADAEYPLQLRSWLIDLVDFSRSFARTKRSMSARKRNSAVRSRFLRSGGEESPSTFDGGKSTRVVDEALCV